MRTTQIFAALKYSNGVSINRLFGVVQKLKFCCEKKRNSKKTQNGYKVALVIYKIMQYMRATSN